jgi:alkanesulfonate monooxygenase SsuD/methylene tetrahydromethanopterin reductase-like flavin-dependent oxidoreductase (luciferase family)
MKIGIGLPNQIRDMDAAVIPRWAERAETAGFSTLATLGRIAYPGVMDTVALTGAAAATQTIGLSSNITLSTVWPAPLLAKELAGIDAISTGRLTLGLGIGGDRPDDFVAEGFSPRHLGKRMDADLETFHRIWQGEPVGGGVNAAISDEFADSEAQSVHAGADGVRAGVESFEAIGADELILHPTITDLDEVGKLADAVLN